MKPLTVADAYDMVRDFEARFVVRKDLATFTICAHPSRVQKLHRLLTSLVDPDTVAEVAFRKKHEVLVEMVQKKTAEEFFHTLVGRLGRGQAHALTSEYYGNRQPTPYESGRVQTEVR